MEPYAPEDLSIEQVKQLEGPAVLDFGTNWCGYCRGAAPLIEEALRAHPGLRHVRVEDGKGRRLGRAFGVKLWPTLVFLDGGSEVARVVRPNSPDELRDALAHIT